MKTTQEILDQNFTNIFNHSQKTIIKHVMREYAGEACEEQKGICAEMWAKGGFKDVNEEVHAILGAPKPELK